MLVKGIMTQMSGSLGGLTASHNRGGIYLRSRTIPVNPATSRQVTMRTILAFLAARWGSALTAAQRAAWDLYGENVLVTNPLGDQVQLSGQQWYVQANATRMQADDFLANAVGTSVIDAGPTNFSRTNLALGAIAVDESDDDAEVNYTADEARTQDGGFILIYQGRPTGPGVSFFAGPYRLVDVVVGQTAVPPTSPVTINPLSTLGYAVAAGQGSGWRAVASAPDGRSSPAAKAGPFLVVA